MPVLEILCSRLRDGVSAADPTLLANLAKVRSMINTKSCWFHSIDDPSCIYIIGEWPSMAAREQFLASPERDEILKDQAEQLEFVWMIHLDGEISRVPSGAPVMSVARLFIKSDGTHVQDFDATVTRFRRHLGESTEPCPVLDGWRIDRDEGKHESIWLTGWESVEAHLAFTVEARKDRDYASLREHYEEVVHVRNMEA